MSTGELAYLILVVAAIVTYSGLLFYGMLIAPGRGGPAAPELRHDTHRGSGPKRAA